MKIHIGIVGGLGDAILAVRWINMIKEIYPNSNIHLFTNQNKRAAQLLLNLWPHLLEPGYTVFQRKEIEHYKTSQFGRENLPDYYSNVADESKKIFEDCDRFFYAHNDGLDYTRWNLPVLNYANHFSAPVDNLDQFLSEEIKNQEFPQKQYILTHLFSRPESERKLSREYIERLLNQLFHDFGDHLIYVICEKKYWGFYDGLTNDKIHLIDGSMEEMFYLAKYCAAFLGIDSCMRLLPNFYSKPTYFYSHFCQNYKQVPPHQQIRWHLDPSEVLPDNFPVSMVSKFLKNAIDNPLGVMYPEIDNLKGALIDRF